jgi:signal transduction histidine kinase
VSAVRGLGGRASLFVTAVVLAGVGILAARVSGIADWSWVDVLACLGLAAAAVVAQQLTIPIRHGAETENLDMTEAVWAAGLLVARPGVLTLGVAVGIVVGQAVRRWRPHKIAFNVGQNLVAISGALLVYGAISTSAEEPPAWLAAALGMGVYFLVNAVTVALVISLAEGEPYRNVLLSSAGLNVLQWSWNAALGILIAVVIVTVPAALPLLCVPLVLSYLTYRGWLQAERKRGLMHEMARTADAIWERGDLTRRVTSEDTGDDVGRLAATLNRMLDRLEAAFRRERRFFSEASHELRTPITICRGHLEVLGANPSPEELAESVAIVVDELDRMGRIVDDTTTLARADTDRFLRREAILIDGFLAEVAAKAAPLLNGRLRITPMTEDEVLQGDPQRLTQALINLLQNAAVHGDNGSPVVLSVIEEGDGWRFEVADEGGGIALEPAERVFQPFSRGRTRAPGSGLGLAIVRTIAEAHGGAAGVVNRPGEGATFWIRVPK